MSAQHIAQDNNENRLIGNILTEEGIEDFFRVRTEIGKSTSAPATGFTDPMLASSPDFMQLSRNEIYPQGNQMNMMQPMKGHNNGVSGPKWNKEYYEPNSFGQFQGGQEDYSHVRDPNANMFKSPPVDAFGIPIRGQSHSLNFHSYQHYASTTPNDPYLQQMRSKLIQPMSMGHHHHQANSQDYSNSPYPSTMDNSMSHNGQFHSNSQSPSRIHQQEKFQAQPYYPNPNQIQSSNTVLYEDFDLFQPVERKFSLDPKVYMRKNQPQNQFQPQLQPQPQQQRRFDQSQPFYGTAPFNKQGPMQNQGNNGMPVNKKKAPVKMPAKRLNSASNMNQNGGPNEQQNFYPGGSQSEMQGPYSDNNYQNNQNFQNQQNQNQNQNHQNQNQNQNQNPGSPTKSTMPLNIKYILANLIDACKDQNGSRVIQQYFEKADREEKDRLFVQIIPHGYGLMADMFGNYVIQKVLELGTIGQKLKIYEIMKGKIFNLSQHTYSCRVIQKALEEFKNNGPVQDEILKELSTDILCLVEDQNGNHVIQKCIETLPAEKLRFIIDKVTEKIERLPFHAFGCRVIQRILEFSTFEQTAPLLKKIMAKCLECCESQYGNYIMQHILEKGPHTEKEALLDVLRKNFIRLSLNKFASNVTEKSAIHANADFRQEVVEVIVSEYYDNRLGIVALMGHPFGNYVVQRLFECSDKTLRKKIYDAVMKEENLEEIKKTNYGKHVAAFVEKLMDIQKD